MNLTLAYQGHSQLMDTTRGQTLRFAPNLSRDPVAFDAALRNPLRFREAISALHDVVINDLRYKPRDADGAIYEAWKKREQLRMAVLRSETHKHAREEILKQHTEVPADFLRQFEQHRAKYWRARQSYSNHLRTHDMSLWRKLMPCDPVVTVADDVVFFECFSADEASYGCLSVDRDATFGTAGGVQFGTTNVDYSWDLYNHFQRLRTYRDTRFQVDPSGLEVTTSGGGEHREEKIDLPPGWLRGFMQIQVAMGLPMRKVTLAPAAVYSMLAWLKRHRARKSPRAIRFELLHGQAPRIVLEPWEQAITSHGTRYAGPNDEPIRIWGGRRLLTLARLLPLAESFEVYLLGTGMPSFWVARMGEMRLTLGLSGWTANDWTRGSALDQMLAPAQATADLVARTAQFIRNQQAATFAEVHSAMLTNPGSCAAALNQLAQSGQVIHDLVAGRYRWRQIMPQALGERELGPENEELVASRQIVTKQKVSIKSRTVPTAGLQLLTAQVDGQPVEMLLDGDGLIKRGQCDCSHHRTAGLRMGPCRHLLALRQIAVTTNLDSTTTSSEPSTTQWYDRLRRWAAN